MKTMNFSVWLGVRRRHSRSYGNDEQQRQAGKDAFSCFLISESQYYPPRQRHSSVSLWQCSGETISVQKLGHFYKFTKPRSG